MRNEYETIDVNKTRKYHQPNEKYSVEHEIRRKDFLLKSSDEKVKTIPDYYLRFSPILKTEVVTGTDESLLIFTNISEQCPAMASSIQLSTTS